MNIDIAFSSCPNDTFIFHAMLAGLVDTAGLTFTPFIADVEELNTLAFKQTYPVTKLSFYAYLMLKDKYELLDSGSALGYGCGPILVARTMPASLEGARIAVPGRYTTANLLLRLWVHERIHIEYVRFDRILPELAAGTYDAGLIIHEGRFVYPAYDCIKIVDLGQWWESKTGMPIPLGCIVIRKDMAGYKGRLEGIIRESTAHARAHPEDSREFIISHAQELDESVIAEHISLYVNEFTLSLGRTGMAAIEALQEHAGCMKIV